MIRLLVSASSAIGLILFVAFVASRLLQSRTRGLSIRLQVFIALAAIVGTFAFGLGLMVIDRIDARAVRFATQAATGEAQLAARLLMGQLERQDTDLETVAKDLHRLAAPPEPGRFELWNEAGELLYPLSPATSQEHPEVAVESPILLHGRTVGTVRVLKPTLQMRRLLADFAPTVLVISLVLGAAAALAAVWIGSAIAAPIEALSAYGQQVAQGQGDRAPVPTASSREVMTLTQSVDSMRRQLQGRPFVETFAADLSHELKNPVAAIRASAEVLDDSALEEPEEARRFVLRIQEAVARIERLLKDLLSLARLEAHGAEHFEAVVLGSLVENTIQSVSAPERVQFSAETLARVRGEPGWLGRATSNLVENGLTHAPLGTPVVVRVEEGAGAVTLVVENEGSVDPYVRKNLFRRFVTTREDKGGTGLGLAIVRAVAEAHGGRVTLRDPGPPRVRFELQLPRPQGTGMM